MVTGLDRLFRPNSIAVIGGGAWGRNIIRNCRKIGFQGEVWPVHPTRAELEGLPTFPGIADLPAAPDAAYIAVNRHQTIQAVSELAARGAGGAVCLASGFREALAEAEDGAGLQDALLAAAGDMTLIGPNCYGFVNYLDGAALWPDQHGGAAVDRGVAIICQSSNMAINITMARRGLPLAYIVTAGNQAQTGISAIGAALLDDDRVTALGLHIEGVDDLRGFEALAEKSRTMGKPIVAIKVGRSAHSRAATVSHTASLAGSDAGSRALLRRLGIAQAESLPVFLETLKLLHVAGPLRSNRIASMSCSGGEASLIADSAAATAVEFPPLNDAQKSGLRDVLGPMVALNNPLDYHTYIWRDRDKLGQTYSAMMRGDLALGVIVLDFPRQDRCQPAEWYDVIAGALRARTEQGKPMALVATLHENMPEFEAQKLVKAGIVPLCGLDEALAAIDLAAWLGQDRAVAEPLLLPGGKRTGEVMDEAASKSALAGHGLRAPKNRLVAGAADAADAADDIGYPVVLKAMGHAHKTEAGAVAIGLADHAAVQRAAAGMAGTGFLVEEMITGALAEVLIGITRDPAHGFVLTLGTGGVLAELIADTISLLVPAGRTEVRRAFAELKISRLVAGHRGGAAADLEKVFDAVDALQAYVLANAARVEEVEVNPLIVTATDAVAVDTLIREAR